MEKLIYDILILHAIAGGIALLTGAIAIISKKGGRLHKKAGKVYFWAMTLVFITGILIAGYRWNKFLFLIAFLSYYSVFSGVRATQLKRLNIDQSARWYDWLAGSLNALANVTFLGLGIYFWLVKKQYKRSYTVHWI